MFDITKKQEILWRNYFSKNSLMTEEEKEDFFNSASYIPYKGFGGIQVAEGHLEKAEKLLSNYIGQCNFDDNYQRPFLTENPINECFCYGKLFFDNSSIKDFLIVLIENNITVVNALFQDYNLIFPEH